MRSLLLPSLALAFLASTTHADELAATDAKPASVVATKDVPTRFALAVNFPSGWIDGKSIGASAYVGLTDHLALRLNVASYRYGTPLAAEIVAGLISGDGPEGSYGGRILDLGVGVVHYSRGLWDGFTLEAGALRRGRDTYSRDDYAGYARIDTTTAAYAGRALIGWSWLIKERVFIAAALGGSAGIETGTEKTENDRGEMMKTNKVDRSDVSLEGYLRFGGAF